MKRFSQALRKMDWIVLASVLTLTTFGLTAIFSLDRGQELMSYPFVTKQLTAFAIGILCVWLITRLPYTFFKSTSTYMYVGAVLLLIGVLLFGDAIRGTKGWFVVAGYSFQPVEFAKVALLVHLAHFFARNRDHFRTWWFLFGSAVIMAVPVVLTLLQPDAGSAMIMVGMWIVMVFVSGIRRTQFTLFVLLMIGSAFVSWVFLLEPYQKDRIRTFMDPAGDPLGRGYNVTQSIIAVGSGQLFGKGLGFGSQSQLRFLPESRNDFIFAAIAEELGFVGSSVILILFFVVWLRLLLGAQYARDDFSMFVLIGFLSILIFQSLINIGMNMGITPVTGIGLPFVSYGGSSLIAQYMMVGIVLTVLVHTRRRSGHFIG